jgi:hypothetical protein
MEVDLAEGEGSCILPPGCSTLTAIDSAGLTAARRRNIVADPGGRRQKPARLMDA